MDLMIEISEAREKWRRSSEKFSPTRRFEVRRHCDSIFS